jgi:hypothetical protein
MKNTLIGMNVKELIAELERRMQDRGIMEIDLKRLEREWADQATRHQLLGQVVAHYRKDVEDAEASLDVAKARAELKIRRSPGKYGVDGALTEALVKANVILHPLYKGANDALIRAKFRLNKLDAVYKASEHRKKGLENEVSLWSQGYFAAPKTERLKHEKARRTSRRADTI